MTRRRPCVAHKDGLQPRCYSNNCKTPGACRGKCGCMACDAHHVDKMKVTWR